VLHKILFVLTLVILLTDQSLLAQKPKDFGIKSKKAVNYYLAAKQQIEYRDPIKAMEYCQEALKLEPEFTEAHFLFTYAAYQKGKLPQAENSLLHLSKQNDTKYHPARLWYADLLMSKASYKEAGIWFGKYLSTEPEDKKEKTRAEVNLRKCRFAEKAILKPVPFKPINLGTEVNSQGDEYMPNLTADGMTLFFTARRPGNMGGMHPRTGEFGEDFYFSRFENGKWSKAENLGPPINTSDNEGAACFSQDGQWVYFTGCNRPDGAGECDLYIARNNGKNWSNPQNLGPGINTPAYETQPWLSADGKTLYFVSARKGGIGGTDIWYSRLENQEWTAPLNLGAPINTPGNEYSPFLHASGQVLYFSSDYHNGFGGMDIFYVKRTAEGWGDIQNMGYPINTPAHERFLFISSDGKTGYFNSDQMTNGWGREDLYQFALAPELQPPPATFVRGTVKDSASQNPISARIYFVSLINGDTLRAVESDNNGKFLLSLPLGNAYAAFVEEPGYLFYSGNFSLEQADPGQHYDLDVLLKPVKAGSSITLRNVFFATNSYELLDASQTELNQLVQLLKKNPGMVVEIEGHTDNEGSDAYNLTLSQNRSASVRTYLVNKGIPAGNMTAKGYGESKPIADNTTEEGRALNRRTEFRIVKVR
jgi:outer membrane protein OmpA-like peptidoglycan-associated protein/tetratricopeptide (TPR) repeat protein